MNKTNKITFYADNQLNQQLLLESMKSQIPVSSIVRSTLVKKFSAEPSAQQQSVTNIRIRPNQLNQLNV